MANKNNFEFSKDQSSPANDNFPGLAGINTGIGFPYLADPNNTAVDVGDADYQNGGRPKFFKSDTTGPSGLDGQQFGDHAFGINRQQNAIPVRDDSTSLPVPQAIEPIVFGDPNDTGLDFRDGRNPDSVTIAGGGKGDIQSRSLQKPNPMGS